MLLLALITCQTPPRSSKPLEEISGVPKPPAFKYILPKEGAKVLAAPSIQSAPVANLAQNAKVKIIEEKKELSGGIKQSWTKIEFESKYGIHTGWIQSEALLEHEIAQKQASETQDTIAIDKSIGPSVPLRGRFILAECVYNSGYGSTPYYFLGSQKQNFIFHDDGTFTFDINVCSGANAEEGSFSQKDRTIQATAAGTIIVFELLNRNTIKIIRGSDYLTCQVCREAYLVRMGE